MKGSDRKAYASAVVSIMFFALLFSATANAQAPAPTVTIISPTTQANVQKNLVSDIPGLATTTDPNLVNPWGISNSPTSPYWIANQGTGKSTLYNGLGVPTALVVTVPAVGIPSGPTGTVFNGVATDFLINGSSANFIFATLDGTIAGRTGVSNNVAITKATLAGSKFTGLTLANNGTANYLYAADFHNGGTIQVFDNTFASTTLAGTFTDPALPVGYAPYNVQVLGGKLYVAYAQPGLKGATTGAGLGIVSVFDTNGNFLQRLVSNGGPLNAPWGMALAPANFMTFGNDLLVGNFGSGQINAFDPVTGAFLGTISNAAGKPIINSGLWAITFGNGNAGSSPTTLFFNAGINGEQDGLFGAITPGPITLTFAGQLVGTTSAAQTITVENTGNAPLILSAAPALGTTTEFAIATTGTTCTNALSIAPGGSCLINVTFTPSGTLARGPVNLTITDNASTSPQVVVVTGTGTAGSPSVALSPATPLTFTGQLVSTTSAAQTITVTNNGSAPLTFGTQAISVTNDFSQTNTCNGATVAINATCTISVSFAPSATSNNPRTGTLSIADNATGSPQTVALSGTGLDFSISVPSTATTTAGVTASVTVTIAASGGFTGPVTITCSATIPQGSCVAPTAPITAPGTAVLTFMTASQLAPPASRRMPPPSTRKIVILLSMLGVLFTFFMARRLRTRLGFAGALLVLTMLAGCAGSNNSSRTPAGSYPITVTATSGAATRSSVVILTVN